MFNFLKKRKQEEINVEIKINKPEENEKPAREIIDGVLYDTSRAEKVISFVDYPYFGIKTLYRTKKQRFFVTDKYGNIRATTEDEAKRVLSKHPGKYQDLFGKVEEA